MPKSKQSKQQRGATLLANCVSKVTPSSDSDDEIEITLPDPDPLPGPLSLLMPLVPDHDFSSGDEAEDKTKQLQEKAKKGSTSRKKIYNKETCTVPDQPWELKQQLKDRDAYPRADEQQGATVLCEVETLKSLMENYADQ